MYINSLVLKLKEAEVGAKCRKQLISVLLYANDAVIWAEDEKLMRWGLEVLMDWCDEWAMEVNVEKSGIMHMRRKGMKNCTVSQYTFQYIAASLSLLLYSPFVYSHHIQPSPW